MILSRALAKSGIHAQRRCAASYGLVQIMNVGALPDAADAWISQKKWGAASEDASAP
jgi:hypothetical protein